MTTSTNDYFDSLKLPTWQNPYTGKTYTGRLLSMQQYAPFNERLRKLGENSTLTEQAQFFADIVPWFFPRKWYEFWKPNVAKMLLDSPTLVPAVMGFLALQSVAMGLTPAQK